MKFLFRQGGLLVALLFFVPLVHAVDPTLEDPAERILERQERLQRAEQLLKQAPVKTDSNEIPLPEKDAKCLQIDEISVTGNMLLDKWDIIEVTAEWQGQCIGPNVVNYLLARLTKMYVDAGYITTRVYIPKQSLQDGSLELAVVTGILEGYQITDSASSGKRKLFWAMPTRPGEVLNLRDIEQGVDQFNSVSSADTRMQIVPGETNGGSIVVIENNVSDQFRGSYAFDNDGSDSTGLFRLRLGFEADNALGINDQLSLFYVGSADTNALATSFKVPFRYWTHRLSVSYSEYLSPLTVFSETFGQSLTSTIESSRLVYRSSTTKTDVGASLSLKENRRFINDLELTPQKLSVVRLSAKASRQGKRGLLLTEFGYAFGLTLFGATRDTQAGRDIPKAQFHKLDFSLTYLGSVPLFSLGWTSTLQAQYAGQSLYSTEQTHLGGRYTVRGFANTITGDSGLYWRNDFNLRSLPDWTRKAGLSPYVFADLGWVESVADDSESAIAGLGFGIRRSGKLFNVDLSVASPWLSYKLQDSNHGEVYFSVSGQMF